MIKKYIPIIIIIVLAVWVGFFFGKKSVIAPGQIENSTANDVATSTTTALSSTKENKSVATPVVAPKPVAKATAPTMTSDGSYLVYYTDKGFSPSSLTIKTGKSVHFVNNSNKAMSLTTTEPNNQVYSEFNQGKTVGRGGAYDFAFMKPGVWQYMNRNNASDKGVIVVQ